MSAYLGLLFAWGAVQAQPAESACGIFSQEVYIAGNAWSGCELKRVGESPLWRSAPDPDVRQVVRLVFSSGHDSSFRYITLVKRADGKSFLISGGLDAPHRRPRERWMRQHKPISPADWDELDRLTAASGTFDHEIGSWDDGEMYLHCRNLSLERADHQGYRFS